MREPSRPQPTDTTMFLGFSDRGLKIGDCTILPNTFALSTAARAARQDRLTLHLAIAFRRRLPDALVQTVVEAADIALKGDVALANIRLAFAGISRVPGAHDLPDRFAMADQLLADGMTPRALMKALGYAPDGIAKYDPDQPRMPAGSGPASGRWTSGDDGAAGATGRTTGTYAISFDDAPPGPTGATGSGWPSADTGMAATPASAVVPFALDAAAPSFMSAGLGATALAALESLAATAGFAAIFGTLFVPWQSSVSTSGSLPGESGASYAFDTDTGLLRVLGATATGTILAGRADGEGIFHDAATGLGFARLLAGSVAFDETAIEDAQSDADADAVPRVDTGTDVEPRPQPKLCPDPGPDKKGSESASDQARKYQEQISRMINPHNPLKYGEAIVLPNLKTGELVYFDDCDRKTGTMIEAKGARLAHLSGVEGIEENVKRRWRVQATSQVEAAGGRRIEWYFAEELAAQRAREEFDKLDDVRDHITVYFVRPQ